jgi:hypothetical protein
MSIYETTSGKAYTGMAEYDNLSGYVTQTYVTEWKDIHGNLWRKTCNVINLGRADPVIPSDPDATLQPEKLWSRMTGNDFTRAANLAAGQARDEARRDRIVEYIQAYGPSTLKIMADDLNMVLVTLQKAISRYEGVTFVKVGFVSSSGRAVIWGLIQSGTYTPQTGVVSVNSALEGTAAT